MIIKNADVVTKDGVKKLDIRIENGRIAALGKNLSGEGLDCTGLTVFPGLIDMHVHLREPGFEKKEDIASGSAAAVKGGFTQICCMPNTKPVTDNKVVVSYILNRAKEVGLCKVRPIGAITEGQKGENLAAIGAMKAAGAVAISEDGKSVVKTNLMANAMMYAADFGLKCLCHCEDASLVDGGVVNEGYYSTLTGLKGSLRAAEDIIIAREICLAESLSLPVHICHVSTYSGVQLIREAKARGVQVTAETCPHYLWLDDTALRGYNTAAKVSPPLRSPADREALRRALKDGTIDILSTDHAPHALHEKEQTLDAAPCGFTGLDLAVSLTWGLVRENVIDEADMHRLWGAAPARIFNLPYNNFEPGDPADFFLFDPAEDWVVSRETLYSKSANTPFLGQTLHGRVRHHWIGGVQLF